MIMVAGVHAVGRIPPRDERREGDVLMGLSDEERRRLEELERELMANDPQLAQELGSGRVRRRPAARMVLGVLTVLIGLVLLIVAIATRLTAVGVIGFLLMGAGAYWFLGKPGPGSGPG